MAIQSMKINMNIISLIEEYTDLDNYNTSLSHQSWTCNIKSIANDLSDDESETAFSILTKMLSNWDGEDIMYVAEIIERINLLKDDCREMSDIPGLPLNFLTKKSDKKLFKDFVENEQPELELIYGLDKKGDLLIAVDNSDTGVQIMSLQDLHETFFEE